MSANKNDDYISLFKVPINKKLLMYCFVGGVVLGAVGSLMALINI